MTALVQRLLERPRRAACWFILLHAALWWLVPHLAQANLPLDVVEEIAWARDPQWVYHKHPPLPAWLLAGADRLSGGNPAVIQLLSPLALAVAFWAVWRLGCRVLSPARALVALLLLEGVTFFSFQAAEFNHNTVQVPLWALAALALWNGVTRERLLDWALLGLWAALSLYGKYFAGFLLLTLLLFLLFEREARTCWRRPGPYLAAAIALLLLLPHLLALWRLDFLPLRYAMERTTPAEGLWQRLWFPLDFALAQALGLAGTLAAVWLLPRGAVLLPAEAPAPLARRYLVWLAVAPFGLVLLASLILGAGFRPLWGMPLWIFLPLGLMALWPRAVALAGLIRALAVVGTVGLGSLGFYLGYLVYPAMTGHVSRLDFPGPQLAAAATALWQEESSGDQFAYVAGPVWEAGNIAFYGSRSALVVIDGVLARSYWIDPAALRRKGLLLVWPEGQDPAVWLAPLRAAAGLGEPRGERTLMLAWQRGGDSVPPIVVHLAVIPPAD